MTLKFRTWIRWLPAWGWLLVLAQSACAADCGVKTVRWFDDAPYSFQTPNGDVRGFNADLVRETLQRMGCTTKFVEMPWARALLELEAGRLDVLPGALHKPERDRFAYFSRPVGRTPNVLFMHKNAAATYSVNKLTDLVGTRFRLGVQIGVAYGPEFDALSKTPEFNARVTPLSLRKSGWKMMEVGRLDGIIADESTAQAELNALGLSKDIVRTNVVVSQDASMVALSKKSTSEDFLKAFDRSLASMFSDGKYREIRERYLPCSASMETPVCK